MQVWCLLQCLSADTSRRRGEEEKGLLPDRLFSRPSPKISGYTVSYCSSVLLLQETLMEKVAKIWKVAKNLAPLTNPVSSRRGFLGVRFFLV